MSMQEFFYIRTNNRFVQIKFSEVIYGEGRGNFVKLICEKRSYLVPGMMNEVCDALPKNLFCRVHRSYLVAIERVIEFDKESLLLDKGMMLPLSNHYGKDFKKRIKVVGRGFVHHKWKSFILKPESN